MRKGRQASERFRGGQAAPGRSSGCNKSVCPEIRRDSINPTATALRTKDPEWRRDRCRQNPPNGQIVQLAERAQSAKWILFAPCRARVEWSKPVSSRDDGAAAGQRLLRPAR